MQAPWTSKHSPKNSNEIIGQAGYVELQRLLKQGKKAILLYGPSGTGKTASVYTLAEELGYELIEVNASDQRNAESIGSVVGAAAVQGSLFGTQKIILVDEIDGLSGNQDRGGIPEVIRIIEKTKYPIIMTALDPYNQKLSPLRKVCALVEYTPLTHTTIHEILTNIAKKEKIEYDEQALKILSRLAGGDARSSINDLQSIAEKGKLTKADVDTLAARDRTETMENALLRVFKTTDASLALGTFDMVDEDLDKIFLWIEENLPKEYTKAEDLARGLDTLAEADKFFGRIRKWQYYRFYAYCYELLSAGIAVSKDEKYSGSVQYKPTTRILKIWMANQKALKKKAVAQRISETTHCSSKRAINDTLPFLQKVAKLPKGRAWSEAMGLSVEEQAWLVK